MSFTGDLEHLPIVDVIQLLYSTRKSGILKVKCRKGESDLVFKDGYIVSASHLNNSIRIGTLLINLNIVTPDALDQALQQQKNAGAERKPLIITLLDLGLVNEQDAYKGLEHLIEMTIVEILTWKKGTFLLDVLTEDIADEYRYYPGKLSHEINVDTQSILMDALRVFDEKVRDGLISVDDDTEEDIIDASTTTSGEGPAISAEDLGLADLDQLDKKIPKVFKGLTEFDPCKIHRQKLQESPSGLSTAEQEELVAFLSKFTLPPKDDANAKHLDGQSQFVIFFSDDDLLMHAVTTVCKQSSLLVFATNEEQNIVPIITQSLGKNSAPFLVLDAPGIGDMQITSDKLTYLRQHIASTFQDVVMVQLATSNDFPISLATYGEGVIAVIPRPDRAARPASHLSDFINFLEIVPAYLTRCAASLDYRQGERIRNSFRSLRGLKEVPEIAYSILKLSADIFPRVLTLIVRENELIAEKSIGINSDKSQGATQSLGLNIPLSNASLLRRVIDSGEVHYGPSNDGAFNTHLYPTITAPINPNFLLLPLKSQGKTLALIYADFGKCEAHTVPIKILEAVAEQSELILENALYRKKLEKAPR